MNTMKRFLCLLLSSIITILSLSSCGKLKDFTEEDRHEALWRQFNVNGLYVETVFADAIDLSGLIFVGHVKKAQKNVFHYTENGSKKRILPIATRCKLTICGLVKPWEKRSR